MESIVRFYFALTAYLTLIKTQQMPTGQLPPRYK